jgi:hypothetical protein
MTGYRMATEENSSIDLPQTNKSPAEARLCYPKSSAEGGRHGSNITQNQGVSMTQKLKRTKVSLSL